MNLIIVESPTKARTIQKFLGKDYSVTSSFGHVRDLPKKELGIDVENDFTPKYVVPLTARKKITPIKKSLQKANKVILATDEDREGEAISWHLTEVLKLDPKTSERIVFHEITKSAIEEALKNPRQIDMDLVDAQQARRILDRLVGYKLSPFLWQKVAKGLSAGRVQSVAVRLIAEREREIKSFKPKEYWSIEALLKKQTTENSKQSEKEFTATLIKRGDEPIGKLDIKTKENADKILKDLEGAKYEVAAIEKKELKRNPFPPFTTSTLQQAAWQKLHFSAKLTMSLAQSLYESGFITYHRTDSLNISDQALYAAKDFIIKDYGQDYWAGSLRRFKTRSKGAQEAHEAIRPTNPQNSPDILKEELKDSKYPGDRLTKLYDLIWRRFIASQMAQAVFDSTAMDIEASSAIPSPRDEESPTNAGTDKSGTRQRSLAPMTIGAREDKQKFTFRANGSMMKSDGFLKVYPIKYEDLDLPPLQEKDPLELIKLTPSQHFTQPPPRFSEATLIKELEKNGIGRPSTYAPIISTIQDRNYVQKDEQKKFFPTDIGLTVNDMLVEHFPEIVDIKFTALIEKDFDEIAQGAKKWQAVIREFYDPFAEHLNQKYEDVKKQKHVAEPTDKICPKCGKPLVIRASRFGKFYACSGFPKCRHTENIIAPLGILCPKCGQGQIHEKRTRRGKVFYACSRYPDCDFALWDKPTGEKCPKCNSLLVLNAKNGVKCSNKDCGWRQQKPPKENKG